MRNEQTLIHDVTTGLDLKIKSVVQSKGTRMVYVDPLAAGSPFTGQELCTEAPYFNPIVVGGNAAFTFHSNGLGADAYRRLLVQTVK